MVPQPIKLDAIPTESIVVKNLLADSIVAIEYREHYVNGSSVHVPYKTRHVMSSRNAQISGSYFNLLHHNNDCLFCSFFDVQTNFPKKLF